MLKVLLLNLRTLLWGVWWAAAWWLRALRLGLVVFSLLDFYEFTLNNDGFKGRGERHHLTTQLLCFCIIGGQALIYGRLLQLGKK